MSKYQSKRFLNFDTLVRLCCINQTTTKKLFEKVVLNSDFIRNRFGNIKEDIQYFALQGSFRSLILEFMTLKFVGKSLFISKESCLCQRAHRITRLFFPVIQTTVPDGKDIIISVPQDLAAADTRSL